MAEKSPTSVWLEASSNPVQPGLGFSLSAHVNRVGHHHVHGDVTFLCDGKQIGATVHRTDSTGVAALGVPGGFIPAGVHKFTAKFGGDGYNAESESEVLTVTVLGAEGEEASEPVVANEPEEPEYPPADVAADPHVTPLPEVVDSAEWE